MEDDVLPMVLKKSFFNVTHTLSNRAVHASDNKLTHKYYQLVCVIYSDIESVCMCVVVPQSLLIILTDIYPFLSSVYYTYIYTSYVPWIQG